MLKENQATTHSAHKKNEDQGNHQAKTDEGLHMNYITSTPLLLLHMTSAVSS